MRPRGVLVFLTLDFVSWGNGAQSTLALDHCQSIWPAETGSVARRARPLATVVSSSPLGSLSAPNVREKKRRTTGTNDDPPVRNILSMSDGFTPGLVSDYETDKLRLNAERGLMKFAIALEVSTDELVGLLSITGNGKKQTSLTR